MSAIVIHVNNRIVKAISANRSAPLPQGVNILERDMPNACMYRERYRNAENLVLIAARQLVAPYEEMPTQRELTKTAGVSFSLIWNIFGGLRGVIMQVLRSVSCLSLIRLKL